MRLRLASTTAILFFGGLTVAGGLSGDALVNGSSPDTDDGELHEASGEADLVEQEGPPDEEVNDVAFDSEGIKTMLEEVLRRIDVMESTLILLENTERAQELEALVKRMQADTKKEFEALSRRLNSLPESELLLAQFTRQDEAAEVIRNAMEQRTAERRADEVWLRAASLAGAGSLFVGCAVLLILWRARLGKGSLGRGSGPPLASEASLNKLIAKVDALEAAETGHSADLPSAAQSETARTLKVLLETTIPETKGRLIRLEEMIERVLEVLTEEIEEANDTDTNTADDHWKGTFDLPEHMMDLLPPPLRNEGELAGWRSFLIAQSVQNPVAADFLACLLSFQACIAEKDSSVSEFAGILYRLSERAYAWWETLDPAQFPKSLMPDEQEGNAAATLGEVNAQWLGALNTVFKHRWPDLEVSAYYPENRFDPDVMIRDEKVSGVRPTLSRPLSWAIAEAGGDKPRILYRARVVTH